MSQLSQDILDAAFRAVCQAADLCEDVFRTMKDSDTQTKDDASPVTIADYGSQTIILKCLEDSGLGLGVVAEEQGEALRESPDLATRIAEFTTKIEPTLTAESLADQLDWGAEEGGHDHAFWTLDPIDGTKGYLRGGQYAIALALIDQGKPIFGLMGCPRLPHPCGEMGSVFVGGVNHPTICHPLPSGEPVSVSVTPSDDRESARLCESVESAHTAHDRSRRIIELLGINPEVVRLDSQAKYAVVARGEAAMYVRLPVKKGYQEKIWDHASGVAVIEAAGGMVTDLDGKDLNFGLGNSLADNRGVLATNGGLHEAAVDAVARTNP